VDLGLTSKMALITGSTAGIGFATAEALAREGARVIINGRTSTRVDAAVTRLRKSVARADIRGIAADVATAAGCDSVIQAFPDVDVLVNNMGIFAPKPFEDIDDADWLRFFEANVLSGVRLA
jgi:NAD(P)-dependent dehydrogenase (short-subunit alcohol dehydrogenase family)